MRWYWIVFLAVVSIFAIDMAWTHYCDWRKARKRDREMRLYNMAAFRGTRKNQHL